MIRTIASKFQTLRQGERGAVLVFVGLCLLPLFLVMGLAIDSSLGLEQKRKLQAAVDIAAKAGIANGNGVAATITSEAQKIFAANVANMTNITGPNISVNTAANTITVSASIAISNTFMGLAGFTSTNYIASTTLPMNNQNLAEVAIVYEVSNRFRGNNYHKNICDALINFVNTLPSNVMVSITPIATEVLLDPDTTNADVLFNHFSPTTNDESANPAFFPIGPNLAWSIDNYNTVQNPFYYADGNYAFYPTEPRVLTSYPVPSTCPDGYPSCPPTMWPAKCPLAKTKTSCSQVYSYISNPSYPVLPLTLNKTLVVNYLNRLKAFGASADGLFPSLISWGWRTIDPNWNDFWLVNSNATSTARTAGQYPKAYSGVQKSMILIFNGSQYWDDFVPNATAYYINKCGDATTVVNGLNHWWMTGYGMVPVPTDRQSYVNDITCENRWYKTMDKSLGLNLSDSTNYNATVNMSSFQRSILNEVGSKFFRICKNIKAQNVDVYLLSNSNTTTLAPCCNTSSNAYTITNTSNSLSTALNAVKGKIVAKVS